MKISLAQRVTLFLGLIVLCLGTSGTVSAQDSVWVGHNCEDAQLLLDDTALQAQKATATSIIIIARLGMGEKSGSLNARRLRPAMDYLKRKTTNTIVGASGARLKGHGRLEVYVTGKLIYVLEYSRNRLIECGV